jgi:hypothetical protein
MIKKNQDKQSMKKTNINEKASYWLDYKKTKLHAKSVKYTYYQYKKP